MEDTPREDFNQDIRNREDYALRPLRVKHVSVEEELKDLEQEVNDDKFALDRAEYDLRCAKEWWELRRLRLEESTKRLQEFKDNK